jgi:sucrose phosphorylase
MTKELPFADADYSEIAGIIARRLLKIYKADFREIHVNRILALLNNKYAMWPAWNSEDIILITYGNSIKAQNEKPLKTLHSFLNEKLAGVFNGVHILPFFPYTSDDGFAVSDYMTVNPALGTWNDISAISADFFLMTDLVINHISSAHPWFKNYLNDIAPGKGYFIEAVDGADYSGVVRPRSTALFTRFMTAFGEKEVWTTFSSDQIDLNFTDPEVLIEMINILLFYISKGARFIRLDAIAFLWKLPGTHCLHLDQTHEIVKLLRDIAAFVRPGTIIITETNVPNKENWSYFGNGDEAQMVYQFSLPPLLLYTLFSGSSEYLTRWAEEIPETGVEQTFLNYTASHDGIGVRPLEGLLPEDGLKSLIESIARAGGLVSMRAGKSGTLHPYELNITWYDAMRLPHDNSSDLHEKRYICSQAIMMAMKGIPAFYIHSLLATPNDHEGVKSTGRYRAINRTELQEGELNKLLNSDTPQKRIFDQLIKLIKIRRLHPAFHPSAQQQMVSMGNYIFAFTRTHVQTNQTIHCISNITSSVVEIEPVTGDKKGYDLISEEIIRSGQIVLQPYQTVWIEEKV